MRRLILLAMTAACLLQPQVVFGQLGNGHSGSSSLSYLSNHEYWSAVRFFGRCFSRNNRQTALNLLATEPGSRGEVVIFRSIFRAGSQPCLVDISHLSLQPSHLRGAIAEGLYLDNVALTPALVLPPFPANGPVRTISDAARCYTSAHVGEVRALIADTGPGSTGERDAVMRIADDFFRCVPAAARRYQFNTTDIRYRLAEALLRTRW